MLAAPYQPHLPKFNCGRGNIYEVWQRQLNRFNSVILLGLAGFHRQMKTLTSNSVVKVTKEQERCKILTIFHIPALCNGVSIFDILPSGSPMGRACKLVTLQA